MGVQKILAEREEELFGQSGENFKFSIRNNHNRKVLRIMDLVHFVIGIVVSLGGFYFVHKIIQDVGKSPDT